MRETLRRRCERYGGRSGARRAQAQKGFTVRRAARVTGMGPSPPLLILPLLLSGPWLELGQCAGLSPDPVCPRKHQGRGGCLPDRERDRGPSARFRDGLGAARGSQLGKMVNAHILSNCFFTFNLFWNLSNTV